MGQEESGDLRRIRGFCRIVNCTVVRRSPGSEGCGRQPEGSRGSRWRLAAAGGGMPAVGREGERESVREFEREVRWMRELGWSSLNRWGWGKEEMGVSSVGFKFSKWERPKGWEFRISKVRSFSCWRMKGYGLLDLLMG